MRSITFIILLVCNSAQLIAQTEGHLSYSEVESLKYMNSTIKNSFENGEIDSSHTTQNLYFWARIGQVKAFLYAFEEPVIEPVSTTVLRIMHLPCHYKERAQVLRIEKSDNEYIITYKNEIDNSLKLSYFDLDKLSKYEQIKLQKDIEKYGHEAHYFNQEIIDKYKVQDSLKFRYSINISVVDSSYVERKMLAMKSAGLFKIQPSFTEVDERTYTTTHFCEPNWIVQHWNGTNYNTILRGELSFDQEAVLNELFKSCQ